MTSNAALAAQVTDLLGRWNATFDELSDWMTGTPDGGPNSDGRYPLTDSLGSTELFFSPLYLNNALTEALSLVSTNASAAAQSVVDAGLAEGRAEAAATRAETAQADVIVSMQVVQSQRDDVAAMWAATRVFRDEAEAFADPSTLQNLQEQIDALAAQLVNGVSQENFVSTITQTGVGAVEFQTALLDNDGTGILPIQVAVTGTVTYRINGRVSAGAPWVEIRAADTTAFLETISWLPYVQLEVTAGTGSAALYIGNK